jgi:hypothetical protein
MHSVSPILIAACAQKEPSVPSHKCGHTREHLAQIELTKQLYDSRT